MGWSPNKNGRRKDLKKRFLTGNFTTQGQENREQNGERCQQGCITDPKHTRMKQTSSGWRRMEGPEGTVAPYMDGIMVTWTFLHILISLCIALEVRNLLCCRGLFGTVKIKIQSNSVVTS
jgi:hypothetical protein